MKINKLPTFSIDLFNLVQEYGDKLKGKVNATNSAIDRYKMLLNLAHLNPGVAFVPDVEVDEIFHLHLLRPSYYYKDSINNFGSIINHIPESKLNENSTHRERIELTKKYWFNLYKIELPINIEFSWCGVTNDDINDGKTKQS